MKKILKQLPVFLFLLPFFFVLHGYSENVGYLNISDCLVLILTYAGSVTFIYFIFLLLYKNNIKASVMACYVFAFYCFFGALHDFLIEHTSSLYKYQVLLPAFLILGIILFIILKRTSAPLHTTTLFLNVLLLIYIFIDLANIGWKLSNPSVSRLSIYSSRENNTYTISPGSQKPDIYFLLFDEYENSASLKEKYNYDNSELDTFLTAQGFNIQKKSTGNYPLTPLSLASILNMSYLPGINSHTTLNAKDFATAATFIHDNEVCRFLSRNGYNIINYSIFDLAGKPSLIEQTILPIRTKLITCRTLFYCMKRDLGQILYTGRFGLNWLMKKSIYKILYDNNKTIELVKKESAVTSNGPKFVYAHILLPHYPFFYDSLGNLKDESIVYHEGDDEHIEAYLHYLPYANARIKEVISEIQKNTSRSAVIIFMGDHGYRYPSKKIIPESNCENQNAVFFPAKNYGQFYDSISGVNQFRVVLNSLFNAKFQLLKDSAIIFK